MPKIAIVADIHANLPALDAVLNEIKAMGIQQLLVAGDIVGYGASAAGCVQRLQSHGALCVMGNHDERIKHYRLKDLRNLPANWREDGYVAGLVHAAKVLNFLQADWLAGLPLTQLIPGGIVAHASLDPPEAWRRIDSRESARSTLAILRQRKLEVGFFGHTHAQAWFMEEDCESGRVPPGKDRLIIPEGQACVIMVGSVGRPQKDGHTMAAWVIWDSDARVVEFRLTPYDGLAVAQEIMCAGLPFESAACMLSDEWREKFAKELPKL